MKKGNLMLSVGLLALCSLTFGAVMLSGQGLSRAATWTTPAKMSLNERMENATAELNAMRAAPEEESTALVSFKGFKNKDFVVSLLQNRNLRVTRMYHSYTGSHTHMGGYVVKDGQSVGDALNAYDASMKTGIQNQIDMANNKMKQLETIVANQAPDDKEALENQKALNAIKVTLNDLQQQQSYVSANGLQVYGVQLIGRNKDIVAVAENAATTAVEKVTNNSKKGWNPILPAGGNQ